MLRWILLLPRSPEPGALAQCPACHPAQCASYAETGMARALGPLHAGELAGLAPVEERASGFRYAFEGDGSGARISEAYEHAGRPPWRDAAALAFAVGAGE